MPSPDARPAVENVVDSCGFRPAEDGQDLLEYGLLSALIALVAYGAVTSVGNAINTVFWQTIAANF